jgi:hypothetical protein
LKPCGTPAAYKRHQRNGEEPCESCRDAENLRRRKKSRKPMLKPCGTEAAYGRHLKAREPACVPCLRAHARRARETKAAALARRKAEGAVS